MKSQRYTSLGSFLSVGLRGMPSTLRPTIIPISSSKVVSMFGSFLEDKNCLSSSVFHAIRYMTQVVAETLHLEDKNHPKLLNLL